MNFTIFRSILVVVPLLL